MLFVYVRLNWLNPNILNNEVLSQSYKLFREDRTDGYGGILIGVKCNVLSDLVDLSSESEACSVQIQLSHNKKTDCHLCV